jgi:LysR family transcriptional regulator, regulator of abg operon
MKLHHLTHFVAVARSGSLHRAAASIGVAQSALSRSLSELEASLGTTLLERSRRGTVLTAAGERFLIRARAVHEELRLCREEAAQFEGAKTGRVTLAMSPTAQLLMLPRIMRRFRQSWPDVHVTVLDGLAESFEQSLLDGSVDLYVGICPIHPLDRGVTQQDLAEIDRIVVARPGSDWLGCSSLRQLVDAAWIQIRSDGAQDELSELFCGLGLTPPQPVQAATSMLAVLLLLQSIDALALVPRSWADAPPAADAFARVTVDEPLGTLRLCALRRAALPLTPAAQSMLDLAVACADHAEDRV